MEKSKFSSSGFLYNPNTKSVLLHKRDSSTKYNPNRWAFFGGRNEDDESPTETFIREIKEELGITIQKEQAIYLTDYLNTEYDTHRYVFHVESQLSKSQMLLGEGADFDWIPLDRVFEYDLTEKTIRDLRLFLTKI